MKIILLLLPHLAARTAGGGRRAAAGLSAADDDHDVCADGGEGALRAVLPASRVGLSAWTRWAALAG